MPFVQIFNVSTKLLAMLQSAGSRHVHNLCGGAPTLPLGFGRSRGGLLAEEAVAASSRRLANVFCNLVPEAARCGRTCLYRVHKLGKICRVP